MMQPNEHTEDQDDIQNTPQEWEYEDESDVDDWTCPACGGTGQEWDHTPCEECDGTGLNW